MSQFALYRKAKELGFTVLLSGIGGDELCYGYPYYNRLARAIQLSETHRSFFPYNTTEKKKRYLQFLKKQWKHVLFASYPYKIDDSSIVHWTYNEYISFAKDATLSLYDDTIQFKEIDVHYSFSSASTIDDVYDFQFSRFMNTLCLYLSDRLGMANSKIGRAHV